MKAPDRFTPIDNRQNGVALIQAAIVLPILALFLFGCFEFGFDFIKYEVAERAVAKTSQMLLEALDLSQPGTSDAIRQVSNFNDVGNWVAFNSPNYICAKSYSDYNTAVSSSCAQNDWDVNEPPDNLKNCTGCFYYIAVAAHVVPTGMSLINLPLEKGFTVTNVVSIFPGTTAPSGNSGTVPRTWVNYVVNSKQVNLGRHPQTLYQNTTNTDVEVSLSVIGSCGGCNGDGTDQIWQVVDCNMQNNAQNNKIAVTTATPDRDQGTNVTQMNAVMPPGACYYYQVAQRGYNGYYHNAGIYNWAELTTATYGAYTP